MHKLFGHDISKNHQNISKFEQPTAVFVGGISNFPNTRTPYGIKVRGFLLKLTFFFPNPNLISFLNFFYFTVFPKILENKSLRGEFSRVFLLAAAAQFYTTTTAFFWPVIFRIDKNPLAQVSFGSFPNFFVK